MASVPIPKFAYCASRAFALPGMRVERATRAKFDQTGSRFRSKRASGRMILSEKSATPDQFRGRLFRDHALGPGAIAHEIIVVGQLGDLPPQIFVVAEREHRVEGLLEVRVALSDLG